MTRPLERLNDNAGVLAKVAAALADNRDVLASDILSKEYRFIQRAKAPRSNSKKMMMRVFARDGFIDRYSRAGTRLVFPAALQLISKLVPNAFPYHRNWKASVAHSAYWELSPTIDHLKPVARPQDGPDDENNWYTTSMPHNAAKSLYSLEELGWSLHPEGDLKEWDGLTRWFLERVEADPALLQHNGFRAWYNAARRHPFWASRN